MTQFIIGIIGLLIGGIINVLADDLPHYQTPGIPRYPDNTKRPITAWLGILAFALGLREPKSAVKTPDKTGNINTKLSWRHPLTEIITSVAFVITASRIDTLNTIENPITTVQVMFWFFYVATLILITIIDIEHRLILFSVIIPSAAIALLDALLTPSIGQPIMPWMANIRPTIIEALLGGALGFSVFFFFYMGGFLYIWVSARIRGFDTDEVAFGYGDVMLVTLSGFILGWGPSIFMILITVILGAIGALLYLVLQKIRSKSASLMTPLPYGPYIAIGTLTMLLYSDYVRQFLQGT